MPRPADRNPPFILEQDRPAFPLPPLNIICQNGSTKESVDIRWSQPSELSANTKFSIIGVNIYRSFNSEYGPYFRLNNVPVGSGFWRDRTRVVLAMQEDVSKRFVARGPTTDPAGKFGFRTKNKPIVIFPSPGSANCTNLNVQVTINGVPAFVESIYAANGEVELRKLPTFDVASQTLTPPVLPTSDSDVILATYRYLDNRVQTDLAGFVFYRVTTVAVDPETGNLVETPLDRAAQSDNREIEKRDWVWSEAVRRNRWLLIQGGEQVKLFIRKVVGPKCGCNSSTHKQPFSDCLVCYGTGIIGGYDGPYDITIAPDDGERVIQQTNLGRTQHHIYDTWTGPSPVVSQRDFIVKMDGDRYGIGPVRRPSNRSMRLQQFFSISSLDQVDIRYQVPIFDPNTLVAPQTRYVIAGGGGAVPMITDKKNIPNERQVWSTNVVGENTKY